VGAASELDQLVVSDRLYSITMLAVYLCLFDVSSYYINIAFGFPNITVQTNESSTLNRLTSGHLPTVADYNVIHRPISWACLGVLNLSDYVHSTDYIPEDHVLSVQMRCRGCQNEELAAVGIRTGICHAEKAGTGVLKAKVLVVERLAAKDSGTASSVAIDKISSLDHEGRDLGRK
jgi:hypothetical protein